MYRNVPNVVIKRLPVYLRALDNQIRNDINLISSRELSLVTGFSAEQIRKDLACFGGFGTPGSGYRVDFLRNKIMQIIGLHRDTQIIIVGMGHLGIAFCRYTFRKIPYVELVGAFDIDPAVVGTKIYGLEIQHVSEMKPLIEEHQVNVAVITVPDKDAQSVAEQLIECGITAILNFTTTNILVKKTDNAYVHNVDLALELQSLMYYGIKECERVAGQGISDLVGG